MMNKPDALDVCQMRTPAPDGRQLARQRAELESRQAAQRRQPPRDSVRELDVALGEAGMAEVTEPRIGSEADPPADERIIGSGDRMHHLALVAASAPPLPPRPTRSARARRDAESLLLPPGPTSRAECRRRCGKAGLCDPSAALGCGGEYCGNASAAAREAL